MSNLKPNKASTAARCLQKNKARAIDTGYVIGQYSDLRKFCLRAGLK